jgi:hypothetical protein
MTSILKVDTIQDQDGNNIINENADTITIGASGDTVTLAAGASQSGFGRSGSVNWDTTPKTANFTGVSGEGYFVDTTLGAITIDLPSTPAAGDIVAIADYNGTVSTNNITIGRNSSNINGDAADLLITKNYAAISFVYVDATAGWRSVDTSNVVDVQNPFIAATGGTITCDGDYKIHTFTGPGTFTVTNIATDPANNVVDYLVVAGGGGGGSNTSGSAITGGGGGAGGYRESSGTASGCYSASPLGSGVSSLPVSGTSYPITVGSGGAGGPSVGCGTGGDGSSGNNSVFSTITSTGGGGGRGRNSPTQPLSVGIVGGSGGGVDGNASACRPGGAGNTPPVSPAQGFRGGNAIAPNGIWASTGGGGATAAGGDNSPTSSSTPGGAGATSSINATSTARAGGGGAGSAFSGSPVSTPTAAGSGGIGGGGNGGTNPAVAGTAGTVNTGGGGGSPGSNISGGPGTAINGAAGGSGIVIIRYKYQ